MVKSKVNKNLVLFIIALAQFMVVLDTAIVNVALPAIAKGLKYADPSSLQWVVTAYTLAFGGFLLLGGRAADLFGRKKIFLFGTVLFSIISFFCGIAQSELMLDLARGAQGFAAAFMSPAALSIILTTFAEGKERNRALGIWGAIAAGGAAAGVLIGGVLTQYLDWRWNFFVNVPVGIFVILMTLKYVPESKADLKHRNLDALGAVSVTSGLMLLVYGLTKAPQLGWSDSTTLSYLIPSVALLLFFIWNERRAKHPLMPLSIFKIRNVSGANLTQLPLIAGMFAMFFFLTLYMQNVLGYSPVKTGLAYLPITVIIGIVSTVISKYIVKIGFKIPMVAGSALLAIGLWMLGYVDVNGTYWGDIFPGLAILSVGLGLTFVSVTIAATNGVPEKESGLASGLLNTSQQIGGALGLAILSGVASSATATYLMINGSGGNNGLQAQVEGFQDAFIAGAWLTLSAIVLTIVFIKHKKDDKIEHNVAKSIGV